MTKTVEVVVLGGVGENFVLSCSKGQLLIAEGTFRQQTQLAYLGELVFVADDLAVSLRGGTIDQGSLTPTMPPDEETVRELLLGAAA